MNYLPKDILGYVYENEREADFMIALAHHVDGYSIGEIMDARLTKLNGDVRLRSEAYNLNMPLEDDDIRTAVFNGLYISSFISRFNGDYQVHFLMHAYPASMKSQFEDEILNDTLKYMMLKTILQLRLDTPDKLNAYLEKIA